MLKFIPLASKRILETQTCWAACIDILSPDKRGIQPKLLIKLNEFTRNEGVIDVEQSPQITMPMNKDYFYKFYTDKILDKRGCKQYQFEKFPSKDFISEQIRKEKPIICNGIHYPLLMGSAAKHCIVIHGYKNEKNTFWLLTLDPRSLDKTYKVAWIYSELVAFHNARASTLGNQRQRKKMDFVTDIGITDEAGMITDKKKYMPYRKLSNNFKRANSLKQTSSLVDFIEDTKLNLLQDYFQISENNEDFVKKKGQISAYIKNFDDNGKLKLIPEYSTLNIAFDDSNSECGRVYLYPAIVNHLVVIEFIFYEKTPNSFTLLGIQEASGVDSILKVKRNTNDGIKYFELNHTNLNYSQKSFEIYTGMKKDFIHISTSFGDTKAKSFFVPISDLKFFQKGQAYTKSEVISLIFQIRNMK